MAVFCRLEKTSLRSETSLTSLCLDTTQNPPSSNPPVPIGCSFHQIGAVRRSSASSSTGSRSLFMSGSVKSNPGGRLGVGMNHYSIRRVLVPINHCYTPVGKHLRKIDTSELQRVQHR